ncbi:MAG: AraC family transcriptional regulator [Bacteroidetes bacterium]|nr:MAG: AraC family transcriptional regulator [Bacteroidota bacterium]
MNQDFLTNEYQARINRVLDYIELHLDEEHSLEDLAAVANFSKYHFHRIFHAMTGETPFQFLTRIRLEKAAGLLVIHPHLPVSDVAFQCGFSSLSLFSRTFRQVFGIAPSKWRTAKNDLREQISTGESNLSKTLRNTDQSVSNGKQAGNSTSMYICPETKTLKWRTTMKLNKSMEVKKLPKMTVAYIRHTGPYQGNEELFQKLTAELCRWAGPRGLLQNQDARILVVYHDDPNVTEPDKLRLSMCLTVPENTKVDGKIGKMEIAAGTYAIGRFEVSSQEFGEAWEWLYGTWLPESGYQPDDGPCFEMYPEEPKEGEKIKVDICVPVKPI